LTCQYTLYIFFIYLHWN